MSRAHLQRAVSTAGLLSALVLASCAHHFASATEPMDDAAQQVAQGSHRARTLAFAGLHALLATGQAEVATQRLDEALTVDPHEPWALMGHLWLATRRALPAQQLEAALNLCEFNPRHALCVVAARSILDLSGTATSLDDRVLERVPQVLEAHPAGDAAYLLRAAMQNVALTRHDLALNERLLRDMGVSTVAAFTGPLSAWHVLSMGEPTACETTGTLDSRPVGPFGVTPVRQAQFTDGKFALEGEPGNADLYVLAVDAQVPVKGMYVVRTISAMDHVVTLDGSVAFERRTSTRPASTLNERAVKLSAGTHRVMVRMTKEQAAGQLTLALMTLDGTPSPVTFAPAQGAASNWSTGVDYSDSELLLPTAQQMFDELRSEAGDALAHVVATFDARGRDHDGARRQLSALGASLSSPFISVLRAELELNDRSLPPKVARGRATRDLENALSRDPGFTRATLQTASLLSDDGRHLDALEQVKTARAARGAPSAAVSLLQAQVELSLGLDAQAVVTAREHLQTLPGGCEALNLLYDVANRRDAAADADAALQALAHCPGHLQKQALQAVKRNQLEAAAQAWRALLSLDSGRVSVGQTLAQVLVAQKRYDDAVALLSSLSTQWPRHAGLLKSLGEVYALMGRGDDALKAREAALRLDGGDLALRRLVERSKTGKELLEAHAISTQEALKAYEAAPGNEQVSAAFLLDAAAIEAFADGSQVDRIHIMQKVIDQNGVQEVSEVSIPSGAAVLTLRTLKPDGSTLEPEGIDGKDTISMPGVQVGDVVEYEYLQAMPSRGPAQPGFTLSNFYFQVARQPNNWSTYTVLAPVGSGLKVDAHNMEARPPRVEGEREVFTHTEKRVAPFIPEPMSSPSGNEWLPFVSVGAGQTGNEGVVQAYADAFGDMGAITAEVEAFAKEAAGQQTGLEAIRAVYVAVMKKLSGRDAALTVSAAASVSQDRGSRLWLLKASLEALGFSPSIVAVRAFTADPAPYLFPHEGVLPYVCLRVPMPENQALWLDTSTRFAPFGELPEYALGEREAYTLPQPGRPLQKLKTPAASARPGKTVKLTMSLTDQGVLTGEGIEEYSGFEAAELSEALESLSVEQRTQALQQALSRYFGGADMSGLEVKSGREVGAKVTVTYRFTAARFGRREGDNRMVLGAFTFPAFLGRRFLQLSSRTTPLFIQASEKTSTEATVKLPAGWRLVEPVAEAKLGHAVGRYLRSEAQNGDTLTILENLSLQQSRVPVDQYEPFGQFAGAVDLMQGRDLLLQK